LYANVAREIVSSPLPAPAIPTPPRRCRSFCTRMNG